MRIRFLFLVAFVLFGTVEPMWPQFRQGQLELGGELAAIRLVGGEQDDSNVSGKTGLHIKYFAAENLALSYNWNYGTVRPRKGNSLFSADPNLPFKTFLSYHLVEISFYPFKITKSVHPYVTAGTGLLLWDLRNISSGGSFFSDGLFYGTSLHDGPLFNAMLNGKIGIDFEVKENLFVSGFFGLDHIFDQRNDNIGTNDVNNRILTFGVSIGYRFFGAKDSDGDGILDHLDAAPLQAEDFDNFQDDDGAPDYDNDNDGIPDEIDKEPLIAEDIDGFEDEDGVPDRDNDWDGIPDVKDLAPNDPEDLDGFQDEDGIPDPDNDGDGVPDITDNCKGEAETFNGYRDDDGCPDEVPEAFVAKGEKIVLRGITFEVGKATIKPESYKVLDEVYESLYAHPEIEVEIRGYTDNTGNYDFNMELSQERADAVRNYLIEKGIDSYRLVAKGYGPKDPIASNATEEGRAKNRRIEFYRIK